MFEGQRQAQIYACACRALAQSPQILRPLPILYLSKKKNSILSKILKTDAQMCIIIIPIYVLLFFIFAKIIG